MSKTIIIIGAGIAGVSVVDGLLQEYNQEEPQFNRIILISTSRVVKKVLNYQVSGRNLETFDVVEQPFERLNHPALQDGVKFSFIVGYVKQIEARYKVLIYENEHGRPILMYYDSLCICTGASPRKLIYKCDGHKDEIDKRMFVIRDTDTVKNFQSRLAKCRRLAIIGNGGISLELVSKITNCEKIWIVKDGSAGLTFLDSGASKFLLEAKDAANDDSSSNQFTKISYSEFKTPTSSGSGPSLGPNWSQDLVLSGKNSKQSSMDVIYNDEVASINLIKGQEFPLEIKTKSGATVTCDIIAVAIGVSPNRIELIEPDIEIDPKDGGIYIDDQMRTSLTSVYAAGDCASCDRWPEVDSWFQMRLWTQARQMGFYAGQCIASHIAYQDPRIYANFDCFSHCTMFFGFKVILLGRFNGQLLDDEEAKRCEVIASVTPNVSYTKIILMDGRIIGSVLVGDSGLEETLENLIYDKIDVSKFKNQLLDNTIDIEDYFD